MKNSNHSASLLSMWVLVLTLGSVSLETWGQNLDLTIPSLEMPSTLVLDSKDKREIMMGWTCCWDKKHISSVQTEHSLESTLLQLKENQNQSWFTLSEPVSSFQWTTFITLQLLDMYSTYRGLQYDCVQETNPLFGERPSVSKMFFVKASVLYPIMTTEMQQPVMNRQDMRDVNTLMTIVVLNNRHVENKSKRCNKL